MLPAGPELWDCPFAVEQAFVVRAFPVSDHAAQIVGAAQLVVVRLEAGLHSELFLEAVLEVAAPAQGCHSLRNKGLCCRRCLCIQTPWLPIFRQGLLASRKIQRRYSSWRKRRFTEVVALHTQQNVFWRQWQPSHSSPPVSC